MCLMIETNFSVYCAQECKCHRCLLRCLEAAAVFDVVALHTDNTFEIFIDQNLVNSGSFLQDVRSLSALFANRPMLMMYDTCYVTVD